jgi:hypothetical protein
MHPGGRLGNFSLMALTAERWGFRGIGVLALALAACSSARIRDLPDGRHTVIATASSGGYTVSRQQAMQDASDYCERSRQHLDVQSFDDLPASGLEGPHSSRLFFTCSD